MVYNLSSFWKHYHPGESSAIVCVSVLKRNAPAVSGAKPTFVFGGQHGLSLLQEQDLKATANEIYADVEKRQPHLFLFESDENGISDVVSDAEEGGAIYGRYAWWGWRRVHG